LIEKQEENMASSVRSEWKEAQKNVKRAGGHYKKLSKFMQKRTVTARELEKAWGEANEAAILFAHAGAGIEVLKNRLHDIYRQGARKVE
jgi:hypothetical protein